MRARILLLGFFLLALVMVAVPYAHSSAQTFTSSPPVVPDFPKPPRLSPPKVQLHRTTLKPLPMPISLESLDIPSTPESEKPVSVQSPSSLAAVSPIRIFSDADLATYAISGSGTASDPYVLGGWYIDLSTTPPLDYPVGIYVANTTKYFIMENCTVVNGGFNYDGVWAENVTHGTFNNMNCTYDCRGFMIINCTDCKLDNSTIRDHTQHGVFVWECTALTFRNITIATFMTTNIAGIYVQTAIDLTIINCTLDIRANTFGNNDGIDIYDSSWVVINKTYISGKANPIEDGVYVEASSHVYIDQTVVGNYTNLNKDCLYGIFLSLVQRSAVTRTTVFDADYGICLVECTSVDITSVTADCSTINIFSSWSSFTLLQRVTSIGSDSYGILFQNSSYITILDSWIEGIGGYAGWCGIHINCSHTINVTACTFFVPGPGYGILLNHTWFGTLSNLQMSATGNGGMTGIYLHQNVTDIDINSIHLDGSSRYIYMGIASVGDPSFGLNDGVCIANITIVGSSIDPCWYGIYFMHSEASTITGVNVSWARNCIDLLRCLRISISNAHLSNVFTGGIVASWWSSFIDIANSTISGVAALGQYGVLLSSLSDSFLYNVSVTRFSYGIWMYGSSDNITLARVNITGDPSQYMTYGLYVYSGYFGDCALVDSNVSYCQEGAYFWHMDTFLITNTTFSSCSEGALIVDSILVTITNSSFISPDEVGVNITSSSDIRLNYNEFYLRSVLQALPSKTQSSGSSYGVWASEAWWLWITDCDFSGFDYCIAFINVTDSMVYNCSLTLSDYGIYVMEVSNYNYFYDNAFVSLTENGLTFERVPGPNYVVGNLFTLCNTAGIGLYDSNQTQIYDNYFALNARHVEFLGTCTNNMFWYAGSATNNIVGGPLIGGNYWDNCTGVDADKDGFLDAIYIIDPSRNAIDYRPLAAYVLITSPSDYSIFNTTSVTIEWDRPPIITRILRYDILVNGSVVGTESNTATSSTVTLSGEGWWEITCRCFHYITVAHRNYGFYYTSSIIVGVDLTPPTLTITQPAANSFHRDTVTVTWSGSDSFSSIDHYEIRIDGGVWIDIGLATTYTFTGLTTGGHTVEVRVFDSAGNSAVSSVFFYVDLVDPTILGITPSGTYETTSTVTISWAASDNYGIDHYEISIDNGRWIDIGTAASYTVSLADGNHTVTVRAYDYAGNYAEDSVWFIVDTTPPYAEIIYPFNCSWFATGKVSVGLRYQDANLKQALLYNGTHTIDVTGTFSYTCYFTSDGQYTLLLSVEDSAGWISYYRIVIYIDTTPPDVSILTPTDSAYVGTSDVLISWTGSDALGDIDHFALCWDNSAWISLGKSTEFVLFFPDGIHTVKVAAFDLAGNNATAAVTFTVDTVPPELVITSPTAGEILGSAEVTVSWIIEDLTPVTVQLRVDGGAWMYVSNVNSTTLTQLSDGWHFLELQAVDAANHATTVSLRFAVDTTPPNLTILSPAPDSVTVYRSVTVSWSASDPLAGIDHYEIRINRGNWINVGLSTSYSFTNLAPGTHTIEVKAVDKFGHEVTQTVTFTVKGFPATATDILSILGVVGLALAIIGLLLPIALRRRRQEEGAEPLIPPRPPSEA